MEPSAAPPARRTRHLVLAVPALLGLAGALFVIRRPLMMSAPACVSGQWNHCLNTFNGVALISVLALPFAALAVWARARRRIAAGVPHAWRLSLAEVGMVYGTVPWLWITLQPGADPGVHGRVSLVPLRDLYAIVAAGSIGQIVGNLLVFAALGFFAPIRFPALASVPRILALAAAGSVMVETAQYVLRLDRVSSVDDVLVNAVGAGLAALASRYWWRAR